MSRTPEESLERQRLNDAHVPGWRDMKHSNGEPKYAPDGTLLNGDGTRSIFDDVDE